MDRLMSVINLAACGLLSAAALWAVLSPRVQDGIIIKLGLGMLSLGFAAVGMALAGDRPMVAVERALAFVHLGLLLVAAGIAIRWHRTGRVYRVDEWINPPTVAIRRPPDPAPAGGSTLDLEDAQRGSRL